MKHSDTKFVDFGINSNYKNMGVAIPGPAVRPVAVGGCSPVGFRRAGAWDTLSKLIPFLTLLCHSELRNANHLEGYEIE
jgi:hypothetical protein